MPANKYRQYYQDGSAARNMYTAAPVPEEFFEEDPALKKEAARKRKQASAAAKARLRAKAVRTKRLTVIGVCVGVACVVGISAIHLVSRSSMAQKTNQVNELQEELTNLILKNEALEAEINNSIDYDAIKETAISDYGMIYPEDGQILTYNADGEGYIKQFKDID